ISAPLLEQFLQGLEIGLRLARDRTDDERLGGLEEAAGLALADHGELRSAVARLERVVGTERHRARDDAEREPPGRVVLRHLQCRLEAPPEELPHLDEA